MRHAPLVAIVPDALQSEPAIVPDALQSEAIKSASNSVLLLASPGTGKTRVLRARMAYLLLRERVPPENILAVTFTQHAAHELQRHVHRMVDGALEGAWVGSFHATCLRMLRENHQLLALPAQVPVLPPSEQLALVRELLRNCLLYTSPSPRDKRQSRMPSSA